MILSLDLSTRSTGYSIFDTDGTLIECNHIRPCPKLTVSLKVYEVVKQLKYLFNKVDTVAIEDTFFGSNVKTLKELSRLCGAVIYSWIEHSNDEPVFYMPTSARSILQIKVKSKAELQLWVLENVITDHKYDIKKYYKSINNIRRSYVRRQLTKKQMEYQITKMSDVIESETGLSNDKADSVIIGRAHIKKHYGR